MHVLGKVLAWFVVVIALVAIPLAARVHEIRKEWKTSLEDQRKDFAEKSLVAEKTQKDLNDLNVDMTRASSGWGLVWDNVDIRVDFERNQAGEIAWHDNGKLNDEREVYEQKIRLVTNDRQMPGISRQGNAPAGAANKSVFPRDVMRESTIYAFQVAADGSSSVFIGSFSRADPAPDDVKEWKKANWNLGAGDTMWKPNWRVEAGEKVETWVGAKWRLRTLVPPLGMNRFVGLSGDLTDIQQQIKHKQLEQITKEDVKTKAIAQEELREYELGGNPNFAKFKGNLPNYMIDGLINAILKAEEERNQSLEEVDRLRRDLKAVHDRAVRLRKENTTLGASLPGSSGTTKVSRK